MDGQAQRYHGEIPTIKKFKCRTFPKEDTVTFDYGIEHILITIQDDKFKKKLCICLNDQDIDKLIEYLVSIRKTSKKGDLSEQ